MADTTFPRMSGWKNGYDPKQVDSFFKRARESFERHTP
ncbi:cell division protein DivIVA, partial [Burkholderia multivorans]